MPISAALGSSALLPAGLGFRNVIINGGFDVWQRGTSQSSGGYGSADRWILQVDGAGATRSMSQQSFTLGNQIPGYEPTFFLRYNQSVAGSGATYNLLDQRIENVRTLAGQQVSVSFWAKADSARTLTSQIQQVFGTGGSAEVQAIATQSHSVTTSWQRFTYTATMASISGKTIGANSYVAFRFNFPNNATFTFDIWGVQVEGNYQPTPFEQRPYGIELGLCQRYFHIVGTGDLHGSFYATTAAMLFTHLPVTMRTSPTATIPSAPYTNALLDYGISFRTPSVVQTQSATANNYAIVAYNGYSATYIPTTWYGANILLSAEL